MTFGVAVSGLYRTIGDNVTPLPEDALPVKVAAPQSPQSAVPALQSQPSADAPVAGLSPQSQLSQLRVKRVLKLDGPLRHGEYVWDDKGVPEGQVFITVDLKAQTLSIFRAGYEIGVSVILYGTDNKPSPIGVFPITEKDANHFSSTYNNAPMPYAMRLTPDGVFIHGSDVIWGNATHGCIGVPTAFAKKLFSVAKKGDLVIVTEGKMTDLR
ncbi:MAG: L,D-transpeptidase [Sphingomonadales bacterium]|nr:MAG: L,D-transpeptidase [Sphingomonadales bacterium]